ncbi:MAG: hypothetical protein HY392_05140 [Candidatus Diapherotrites archaeon]|nr:hypothetical protein [Candidatus Diapherotrites archaeon]
MSFRNLSFLLLVATLILSVSFVSAKDMDPDEPNEPVQGEPKVPDNYGFCWFLNPSFYCDWISSLIPFITIGAEGNP